jgi:hypothetical protein
MPKRDVGTLPSVTIGADVNRLLTELRLQRTLMERALDMLGGTAGTKQPPKGVRKRQRKP